MHVASPCSSNKDNALDLSHHHIKPSGDMAKMEVIHRAVNTIILEHQRLVDSYAKLSTAHNFPGHESSDHQDVRTELQSDATPKSPRELEYAYSDDADRYCGSMEVQYDSHEVHEGAHAHDSHELRICQSVNFKEFSRPEPPCGNDEKSVSKISSGKALRRLNTHSTDASLPSVCKEDAHPPYDSTLSAKPILEMTSYNASGLTFLTGSCGSLKMAREYAMAQGWIRRSHSRAATHGRLGRVVSSHNFDLLCAVIIVLNSVLLGAATEYAATHNLADERSLPVFYAFSDHVFGVWFLIELLMRIGSEGCANFYSCLSSNFNWNVFDTVIVFMNIVEVVMKLIGGPDAGTNLTTLRMLRVLRVARALRIVRLVRLFRELRMMVLSILSSFTTLLWALVLLLISIFIFGIFLTQNVTTYLYKDYDTPGVDITERPDFGKLEDRFGTLQRSVYTLFLAVTDGVSWQDVCDPLFRINLSNGLLFCFYIFFTMFAMLNIITGIFLDSAMKAAQSDKDECISEQLYAENSTLRLMQKIFDEADEDGSGTLTYEEFNRHLSDARLRAHLASLGIESGEAEGLFRLLDLDSSGAITVDEFLVGCMRLKGHAKSIDVATIMYENKRMVHKWTAFMKYVERQFKHRTVFEKLFDQKLQSALSQMVHVQSDILRSLSGPEKMCTHTQQSLVACDERTPKEVRML